MVPSGLPLRKETKPYGGVMVPSLRKERDPYGGFSSMVVCMVVMWLSCGHLHLIHIHVCTTWSDGKKLQTLATQQQDTTTSITHSGQQDTTTSITHSGQQGWHLSQVNLCSLFRIIYDHIGNFETLMTGSPVWFLCDRQAVGIFIIYVWNIYMEQLKDYIIVACNIFRWPGWMWIFIWWIYILAPLIIENPVTSRQESYYRTGFPWYYSKHIYEYVEVLWALYLSHT